MTVADETPDVAASFGHTFVCYARHDEAFAIEVAGALRDRGIPIWIDQWDIQPGADWSHAIDAALNACARFLIVLSPEAVRSDEVRGELRVALNTRKRIIPLLYRPCEIPRQLLLRHHIDFTRSREITDASMDRLAQALRADETGQDAAPTSARDSSSLRTLLEDVRAEARARLQAIGTATPIPILLEPQPHQVVRPWDNEAGVPVKAPPAPPATDILELFDDAVVGGRLLILGAPGSGKTTVLLQLMEQLIARADVDQSRPVPVLLSLASFKDDKPLGEWLVEELKAKHGVRTELGMRWRDDHRIAPLLDGLDELPPERQQACVEAINEFHHADRPPCLVVCCRQAEYENLTVKLRLRGAVSLRPLEAQDIRTYLDRVGRSELWKAIHADPELIDMARSPLLLSFMSGLADEPDARRWQDAPSVTERRRRLFDTYLSSRASADANPRTYSREQTLRWLRQLATTLKRQGHSEFLIEQMQPEWLGSSGQRWSYRAGVLVVSAGLVAFVFHLSSSIFGLIPPGNVGLALRVKFPAATAEESAFNLPVLLLIAVTAGGLIASRRTIVPIETLTWSWSRAWENTRRWAQAAALAGLDYGMALGIAGSLIWQFAVFDVSDATSRWQGAGRFCGLASSGLAAVYLVVIRPSGWLPFARRPTITPRVAEALIAGVLYALVIVLTLSGIGALFSGLAVFAILGFSAATDRSREWLLRALTIGIICGATIAALSGLAVASSVSFLRWLSVWVAGGLAVGIIAGMAIGLAVRSRQWWRSTGTDGIANIGWIWWRRTAVTGAVMGLALGLAAVLSMRMGIEQPIRGVALFLWWVQIGFVMSLVMMCLGALGGALFGTVTAGVLGALAGAIGGAAGADVERRLVPNQGIRQSALNVALFAALGTLIIGVPYGLLNVSLAALAVGVLPGPGDWLRLGLGAGVSFGLLAGLLPGAACIQHLVLRSVLGASGTLPLRYGAFLNFATQRRLLQRVGGRYRFIHVLLRDHLGGVSPAPTAA